MSGEGIRAARETMDRLYSPGGCPWDARQTHASLVPYLLEESHELIEAIEDGGREDVIEELGDVLLQVLFHARLGQDEAEPYDIDTVAEALVAKLRRRHPHVFSDPALAADQEALGRRWEELKEREKPERTSVLDGIPPGLPALARAQKVVRKARRVTGLPAAEAAEGTGDPAGLLGAELFALVARAEDAGVDAESALRAHSRERERAVRAQEADASRSGADDTTKESH